MLGDEALVRAVLEDYTSAPLGDSEKALFAFIAKVNKDAASIRPDDIAALHSAGWSDEAIYDAIMVCALFNFYNRWIHATGVHAMSEEAHRASGKRLAERGYLVSESKPPGR